MTVEVTKNDAPTFLWMHEVERQISVRWAVYIEDLTLFFVYYDADSVNFDWLFVLTVNSCAGIVFFTRILC